MNDFVHLHLHSEYSLLDGACRIADIPRIAKAMGHKAVALTDHGALYGAVAFWRACIEEGIRPIIGCEVYVAPRGRFQKDGRSDFSGHHLVLLAQNETGYQNLIKLVSLSFTEGFYSKPRVDKELLASHSEGLIALSACLSGEIPSLILAGDFEGARRSACWYADLFGPDHFFLEMQNHGLEDELRVCTALRNLSSETGIPLVITNDVHYLKKSDARIQNVLLCMQTGRTVSEGSDIGFDTDEFYFKSYDEMRRLFPRDTDAFSNTVRIAEMCDFSFRFGDLHLPTFPLTGPLTHKELLERETREGFEEKIRTGKIVFDNTYTKQAYEERLSYELSVIHNMGFDAYYLIVQDFVRFAKTHNIPVGPGRGSGAGSLVAYCISITDVDSLRFDLLFERFLNPERISLPDFDIDFCYEKRDQVIQYVKEKYGEEHVAQIITFGTLQAKAALRDTARAMGIPYADADRVARLIPSMGFTIDQALKLPDFKDAYEESAAMTDLIDTARALEGMPRHISTHAAGVVITELPVSDYVPVSVSSGVPVAAYDMNTLADLGLVKFDFLGLRYLTVLHHAEENVKRVDPRFSLDRVPFDDEATYKTLSKGDTDGVFQLESSGIKAVLIQLRPTVLEDIIACIALYRPGPMDSIDTFIARKNGAEPILYDAPQLDSILSNTYGCIVYQEQVMQIFRALGGYSFAKADLVRRAMSKKKADVMEAERANFLLGARERGVDGATAGKIFDDMAAFANYAFNKSHATAYAFLSYRTAYMKTHYPAEYTAALLSAQQTTDLSKCRVPILPPDINESCMNFSVSGQAVRYGFLQLKNIGASFSEAIIRNRRGKPYLGLQDFLERMARSDLNKRQVESLIRCGAFDRFGISRHAMLLVYDKMMDQISANHRSNVTGQLDFFSQSYSENDSAAMNVEYPDVAEYPLRELLRMEKDIAGICFSGHPMDEYKAHALSLEPDPISSILNSEENQYGDKKRVKLCGIVVSKNVKLTKAGQEMAFVTVEDFTASTVEVIVFPKQFDSQALLFDTENAVWIEGTVSLREDEKPKILFENGGMLLSNTAYQNAASSTQLRRQPAIRRMYLKVPSVNSHEASSAITLLYRYRGDLEVVFYDASTRKYSKISGCTIKEDENLIRSLKELLGDGAVRIQ